MRRVFSHNSDVNFNDFLKNKKGIEIIKNMKTKHTNFTPFQSYDLFKTITKTYYKYQIDYSNIEIPVNIKDSKTSYLIHNDMITHMNSCYSCQDNNNNLKTCKELNSILRGKYESQISNKIFLHNRINIDDFCISRLSSFQNTQEIIKSDKKNTINSCKCLKLCKETKPLFI